MNLYIDPSTGSMLFTILVGLLGTGVYFMRNLWLKLQFMVSGGKNEKGNSDHIPIAIFSDDKRYWNVFEPICREFDRRKQTVVFMTASEDDPALKEHFDHVKCMFIGEGNKAFAKLNSLSADVFVATTPNLDVYQWKRSKHVAWYAHVLHAAHDPIGYRMFGLDAYDAVLLSGDYQIEQVRSMEKLRNLPTKELPLVGQPYMDELLKRMQQAPALPAHPTTVLLAPSWGESGMFNRYGSDIIRELLKTGYHIIVRPHPQTVKTEKELLKGIMDQFPESEDLEWNFDTDNFEVLRRSDIMISDFSGVMFDFTLVFDKPLIYTENTYNPAPYDSWWYEGELWMFKTMPKLGKNLTKETLPDLKNMIDQCLHEEKYRRAREQARAETWVHIGEGTKRTVDYLMDKYQQLTSQSAQGKNTDSEAVEN